MEPEQPHHGIRKRIGDPTAEGLFELAGEASPGRNLLEKAGDFIGHYQIIERLGEGGFGIVWRAQQHEPIQREVALKVIKPGMDSREIVARFEAERQALARMEHPNIAGVLDAGTTPGGRPYFVMELVRGQSITSHADEHRLTIQQRLELFIPVCQAVQHAHQKAILHRDLKPSNILVVDVDGKAVPKVIDFGIAKALGTAAEEALQASLMQTRTGSVIGTPRYMSPEQAGASTDMDTRSDIYTLGVILYELLTGDTPLSGESLRKAAFAEVLRMVREETPRRPSTRVVPVTELVQQTASRRAIEPGRLRRILRGDLDWIALKALEKERERRYESAAALAADIERHLRNEPVEAGPPSVGYRLGKFARRNRLALTSIVAVALALLGATGVSLWQARRATRAEADTRVALGKAEKSQLEAEANFNKAREAVDQYLSRVTDNPRLNESDFHELRKQLLETAVPFYEQFVAQKSEDPKLRADQAVVLGKLASVYETMGDIPKAEAGYRRAIDILEKLAANFPNEAGYRRYLAKSYGSLGFVFSARGESVAAETEYRHAMEIQEKLARDFPNKPEYREELGRNQINLANLLMDHGQWEAAMTALERSLEVLEKLASDVPSAHGYRLDLAKGQVNMGHLLTNHGQLRESETAYRQALEVLKKLVADFPSEPECQQTLAMTCRALGDLLYKNGSYTEAITFLDRGTETQEKLVAKFPSVPNYRTELAASSNNLGIALADSGQSGRAEACFRRAAEVEEKLVSDFPTLPEYRNQLADHNNNLGRVLQSCGQLEEAEKAYRHAMEIKEKLTADFPNVPEYRLNLASNHYNFGRILQAEGKIAEAETSYRHAIDLQTKLTTEFPSVPDYQNVLALIHTNLGALLALRGKSTEAEMPYRRAIELETKLTIELPSVPDYRVGLANCYNGLGLLLADLGRNVEAETPTIRALEIKEKLATDFPSVPSYQSELGGSLNNLANVMSARNQWQEARGLYERAIASQRRALAAEPKNVTYRRFLRNHYWGLSKACIGMGDHANALSNALELPKLYPTGWEEYHRAAGMVARCVPLAQNDTALNPDQREQTAESYARQAVELLRQAIANGYKDAAKLKEQEQFASLHFRPDFQSLVP